MDPILLAELGRQHIDDLARARRSTRPGGGRVRPTAARWLRRVAAGLDPAGALPAPVGGPCQKVT